MRIFAVIAALVMSFSTLGVSQAAKPVDVTYAETQPNVVARDSSDCGNIIFHTVTGGTNYKIWAMGADVRPIIGNAVGTVKAWRSATGGSPWSYIGEFNASSSNGFRFYPDSTTNRWFKIELWRNGYRYCSGVYNLT